MFHRNPFLLFLALISFLVLGMVGYFKSSHFENIAKKMIEKNIPRDLGLVGKFEKVEVHFFPPALELVRPEITLEKKNIFSLPSGSFVRAESLELEFLPLQAFSGSVHLNTIRLSKGHVRLKASRADFENLVKISQSRKIKTNTVVSVRFNDIELEDIAIEVEMDDPSFHLQAQVDHFTLEPSDRRFWIGGSGAYDLSFKISQILKKRGFEKEVPLESIEHIQGKVGFQGDEYSVEDLEIKNGQLKIKSQAMILGNEVSGKFQLFSSAEEIAQLLKKEDLGHGEWGVKGEWKAKLDSFSKSLQVRAEVQGNKVSYQEYSFEEVQARAKWFSPSSIEISDLTLSSPSHARVLPHQKASGGEIQIPTVVFNLNQSEHNLSLLIKLKDVHPHWLAGNAITALYPIDFKANGNFLTKVTWKDEKNWKIEPQMDLQIQNFVFDNQKYREVREYKSIVEAKEFSLKGGVEITPHELLMKDLKIKFPKSGESALVGKVNFSKGIDLKIESKIDLEDIQSLAGTPIRGTGSLATSIQGPYDHLKIAFLFDLKDAQYISLFLGDVKGKITLFDDRSLLVFEGLKAKKNQLLYQAAGEIDLLQDGVIDMKVSVAEGEVSDFFPIFKNLTQNLSWFPEELVGKIQSEIQISGKVDLDHLKIDSQSRFTQLRYLGERVFEVQGKMGYDQGRYYAKDVEGKKIQGSFFGEIEYLKTEELKWSFYTQNFIFRDFGKLSRLDLPMKGELNLSSKGKGKIGKIDAITVIEASSMELKGKTYSPSQLTWIQKPERATFQGVLFGDQAKFDFDFDETNQKERRLLIRLQQFDFSPFLYLLNPKLLEDPKLRAITDSEIELKFYKDRQETLSGIIDLRELELEKQGSSVHFPNPKKISIDRGSFSPVVLDFLTQKELMQIRVQSKQGRMSGESSGKVHLSFLEFFASPIEESTGSFQVDLSLGGKILEPKVFGKITLENGTLKARSIEQALLSMETVIQIQNDILYLRDFQAQLGKGRMEAEGKVELFLTKAPTLQIRSSLHQAQIRIPPFQFVRGSGNLDLVGDKMPYTLQGSFSVEEALYTEKFLNRREEGDSLRTARFYPDEQTSDELSTPFLKFQVRARADRGIFVKNDLLDLEGKGEVLVLHTITTPRIVGGGEVVQGVLKFKDQVFDILSGGIAFENPMVLNPKFNLTANTEKNGIKIQLFASGTKDNLKVDLNSTPSYSEQEIISLLALGNISDDFKRARDQSGALEQGEAASLLLHSLEFNRNLEQKTGFQFGVDEASSKRQGVSAFRNQIDAVGDVGSAPKVIIRRPIGKKVQVSVGSTVGLGGGTQQEVNAEVKVTRGMSVIGAWETYEGVNATDRRTSFGADIKLQKRFK